MSQIKMWEFHDFHGGCTGKLQTNPDVAMRCIEVTLRCWEVTCVQRKKLSNPWDGQCQKLCQKPLKPCHNSLCWTARCVMLNPILWELFEHAWLFFNATLQQISSPKPDSCQVPLICSNSSGRLTQRWQQLWSGQFSILRMDALWCVLVFLVFHVHIRSFDHTWLGMNGGGGGGRKRWVIWESF